MIHETTMQDRYVDALALIDQAIEQYKPSKTFALFSGGHDSLTTTHVASHHPSFSGVVHINTGIGIPQTNQFVRDTCQEQGWELHELKPATTYLQLVVRYGFPSPASHSYMYRYLKERPLKRFISSQKTKPKDCILLCAGVRSQESTRRMGHVEPIRKDGAMLWVALIHDWSALDVTRYVNENGLKRNEVKDKMHISGECLCGSFATRHERQELAAWFPKVDEELGNYEEIVQAVGDLHPGDNFIAAPNRFWGYKGGNAVPNNQMEFPMCWNCRGNEEAS